MDTTQWIAGRMDERNALAAAFAQNGCFVLSGLPGSGKTRLLRWLVDVAIAEGRPVLRCTPAAIEASISGSALSEMLCTLPTVRLPGLDHEHAVVLAEIARGGATFDAAAARVAFHQLVLLLGADQPVLIALDDVQWIDPFSAEVLSFAIRRTGQASPVLAVYRTGAESLLIDALAASPGTVNLRLGPMPNADLAAIAARELGGSSPVCMTIAQVAAGSPLRARELARLAGIDAANVFAFEHIATENNPFTAALNLLPDDLAEVLFAAVTLNDAHLDVLISLFGRDVVTQTVAQESIRRLFPMVDGCMRADHPLVVDAVIARLSPLRRAQLHRSFSAQVRNPIERARHLSQSDTERSAEVAAEILAGSRAALGSGSLLLAHQLALRSLSFLPPDAATELLAAEMWLASVEFTNDDDAAATSRLRRLIAALCNGRDRTAAILALANSEAWGASAIDGYLRFLSVLEDESADPDHRAEAGIHLTILELSGGDAGRAARYATAAHERAEQFGGQLHAEAEAVLVTARFFSGEGLDSARLDAALAREDLEHPLSYQAPPLQWAPFLWTWTGDARALDGFRRRRENCLRRGATTTSTIGLSTEVRLLLQRGRRREAAIFVDRAISLAEYETPLAVAMSSLGEARLLAHTTDDSERVLALVDRADQALASIGFGFGEIESFAIRVAELARTNAVGAAQCAIDGLRKQEAAGYRDLGLCQGLMDMIEVLIFTGHPKSRIVLSRLDEVDPSRADLVRGRQWRDACLRVANIASPDDTYAHLQLLDELIARWKREPELMFWAARAAVVAGRALRRSGHRRASSQYFADAVELFTSIEAFAWVATITSETERDGRLRHGDQVDGQGLTGNERQVAEMAANGSTNREIAKNMFVSEKTVEAVLSAVYRKLEVSRRSQLHTVLRQLD